MSEYISTEAMASELGLSRAYLTDRVTKRPDFPAPALRLSRKTVLWRRTEFEDWQRAQAIRAGKR